MGNNDNLIFVSFGTFDHPIGVQITETQFEQLQTSNTTDSQANIIAEGIPPEGPYIQVGAIYVPLTTTLSLSNTATTTNNIHTSASPALEPTLNQLSLLSLAHPDILEDTVTVTYPRGNIIITLTNNEQSLYPWNTYLRHDQSSYSSNPAYQTLADGEGNFNQLLTFHNLLYSEFNQSPIALAAWQSNNQLYQQMSYSLYLNQLLRIHSEHHQTQSFTTEITTAEVPRYSTIFTFNPFHAFPNYETFAASYGMSSNTVSLYQTLHTHWISLQASVNPHGTIFMDQSSIADGAVIHHEVDFSGAYLNPFPND